MTRLLVDVFLPGSGKVYEFQLDGTMTVGQATISIVSQINETEKDIPIRQEEVILSDVTISAKLKPGLTLQAAGVRSGHRLILV